MEEIQVGDYIRTVKGEIFKIIEIDGNDYITDVKLKKHTEYIGIYNHKVDDYVFYLTKQQINECKYSPNIIDLVEEGDFVNGYICKRLPNFGNEICNFDLNTMEWTPLENIDVWYDIVTHQQFNQMKYIVGDESNE